MCFSNSLQRIQVRNIDLDQTTWKLNYNPSGKKNTNEKPQKCTWLSNVLAFLSEPERTYWSLTPLLDIVVIEKSLVKTLRLRGNPWRLYRPEHLPSQNWTYDDTGLYSDRASYLSMKVHLLKMRKLKFFKPLLPWSMVKNDTVQWPHKLHPDLQLWSLV